MKVALAHFWAYGIQFLYLRQRAQGRNGEHLSLSAGEETGAVGPGQDRRLAAYGPYLLGLSAIWALTRASKAAFTA